MKRTKNLPWLEEWIDLLSDGRSLLPEMSDQRIDEIELPVPTVTLIVPRDRIQCPRKLSAQAFDQSLSELIVAERFNGSTRRLSGLRECVGKRVRQQLIIETVGKVFRCHDIEAFSSTACRVRLAVSMNDKPSGGNPCRDDGRLLQPDDLDHLRQRLELQVSGNRPLETRRS
jgi:hypothetical protein